MVLLLVQSSEQLSEKPDVLQNAVENARSLLGRVDVDDVGRLEMYRVDLEHWWSLILGPDVAVEHGGTGLAGNREVLQGMARGVFQFDLKLSKYTTTLRCLHLHFGMVTL